MSSEAIAACSQGASFEALRSDCSLTVLPVAPLYRGLV
jgi:hypothetical protein